MTFSGTSSFSDLKFGDQDKGAQSVSSGDLETSFARCVFTGGGYVQAWEPDNPPYNSQHVMTITAAHITFDHCIFNAPLYGATDTTNPRTYHWNNVFGTGNISYIDFTACLFKASNRFQIELWDSSARRAQQINFYDSSFEVSECGHIDYALDGAYDCTVDNCTFASNGNGSYPAYPSDICLEASAAVPLHGFTITNNYMVRGLFTNILMGHAAYDCYVDSNTLRNDLGTVGKHDTSGGLIKANHADGDSNYITVTNNTITCDGTPTAPDRWGAAIDISGDYAVVTGNTVTDYNLRPSPSYTGPDVLVVGSDNTVGTLVTSRVNATDNVCTDGVGF